MAEFKYNEFTAEIDTTDVEFLEKYEKSVDTYNTELAKLPEKAPESEKMRFICNLFFKVFDDLFGDDAHKQMFGNKMSAKLCTEAFVALIDTVRGDNEVLEIAKKAVPNRATRRAQKKVKTKKAAK